MNQETQVIIRSPVQLPHQQHANQDGDLVTKIIATPNSMMFLKNAFTFLITTMTVTTMVMTEDTPIIIRLRTL